MHITNLEQKFMAAMALTIGLAFQSCKDDVSVTAKTYQVENVTGTSADIRCTVAITGDNLVDAGVCFSTTLTYPKAYNSRHISSDGSLTDFTVKLTGLSPDSTYHFRAYASLGDTTYYGTTYSFIPTNPVMKTMVLSCAIAVCFFQKYINFDSKIRNSSKLFCLLNPTGGVNFFSN